MIRNREWWEGVVAWPSPVWRLCGYRKAPVGTRHFQFAPFEVTPIRTYRELRQRTFEPEVIDFVESHLHTGQVFVDVGAWFGIYTLLGADLVGKMGKVYAFEPDPKSRDFLEKNMKINHKGNVEVLPFAVSSDNGFKWISNQPASSLTRVYSMGESHTKAAIGVGAVTLDEFFEDREHPDMIKIDVEGHEVEVVEGGLHTLSNASTTIILELHSVLLRRRGLDVRKFIQRLEVLRGTKSVCLEGDPMAPGMPPHLVFA